MVEDPVGSGDNSALDPANYVFLPLAQEYRSSAYLVMRTESPHAVEDAVRAAVRTVDDDVALSQMVTVDEAAFAWLRPIRLMTALFTSVGVIALAISLLGIYGVVAHFVGLRRREFGIRAALGATPRHVAKIVLDYTLHLLLVGLLPGVLLAVLVTRVIQSNSLNLMPQEIPTWIIVPLFVLLTGVAAGYLPARRAARVDPSEALRDL